MKDATQDPARQPGDPVRLQRITNGTAREHARYGSLSMIDRGRSGRGNAEFLPTLDYQFWQDSWAPSATLWFPNASAKPETFEWNAVATLLVWMMTLFIQRSNRRDSLAVQAKLDELLRSHAEARGELAALDDEEPEEIEKHREEERLKAK